MTNAMWELYWLTRVITINGIFGPLTFLFPLLMLGCGAICLMAYSDARGEEKEKAWMGKAKGFGIAALCTFFLFGAVYVFTPDKDQAAFIVAGGAVVAAAQSDAGQKIAQKSVAVLEGSLDNILGKEAVKKAQIDVEKKVVDTVKAQMGIKDESKGTNGAASSGS